MGADNNSTASCLILQCMVTIQSLAWVRYVVTGKWFCFHILVIGSQTIRDRLPYVVYSWMYELGYAPKVLCAHNNVTKCAQKEGKWPPQNRYTPYSTTLNEWKAPSTSESPLLTLNGDYMLPDLVLQGQVINALDQVVDCVNVRVDRLEPMDLCPDGCWVGQNKLRARWAGLGSLARNSPRTELTSPWARRRSGSELGRDGLGDGNGGRDRAWGGHGWLRLLRDTGHRNARLEIHLGFVGKRLTLFTAAAADMRTRILDSSDANKRSPRELMVWRTIGAEASIVGRQLQQNASRAHIITTWLWFIFRYWPNLSRAPSFFCGLQTRNAYHWDTPLWAKPLFWSTPLSSVALVEADNGLGCSKAPWSPASNASFLRWNEITFSPLWSKWSLPSALLRMLKRHHHVIVLEMGEGVIGFDGGGENRNVRLIITYLTVTQPQESAATRC